MAGKPSRGNPPENFGKTFTTEEYKANGRKGGIASGKAKREKKRIKEILEILLELPLNERKNVELADITSFNDLKDGKNKLKNITVNEAIQVKQVQRALNGDLNSAIYIRDTVGDKPSDNVNVNAEVNNPFKDLTTEELRKLVNMENEE